MMVVAMAAGTHLVVNRRRRWRIMPIGLHENWAIGVEGNWGGCLGYTSHHHLPLLHHSPTAPSMVLLSTTTATTKEEADDGQGWERQIQHWGRTTMTMMLILMKTTGNSLLKKKFVQLMPFHPRLLWMLLD